MRVYLQPDLLIIDDFGLRDLTPLQAEDFYELVCERYRSGSLIVVSNRTPKDWYALSSPIQSWQKGPLTASSTAFTIS